jgi:hypothetical protein
MRRAQFRVRRSINVKIQQIPSYNTIMTVQATGMASFGKAFVSDLGCTGRQKKLQSLS